MQQAFYLLGDNYACITSQLSGLNGQIKQIDDVTVEYHLYPTGQDKSVLDNVLKGKAKSDGEAVSLR